MCGTNVNAKPFCVAGCNDSDHRLAGTWDVLDRAISQNDSQTQGAFHWHTRRVFFSIHQRFPSGVLFKRPDLVAMIGSADVEEEEEEAT